MPAHQAAALHALYPWWNAPWSTLWQRTWHQVETHVRTCGPLQPARSFPGIGTSLREWLYLQCARYPALHPEQQRLMAAIGIDAATAAATRPGQWILTAGEEALAHARSYAADHGHLAIGPPTVHRGYPLGRWLAGQRSRQRRGVLSQERREALTGIDPWWCPPWNLKWQRSYHRARHLANGVLLRGENSIDELDHPPTRQWLLYQLATYETLMPGQQQLLAGLFTTNGESGLDLARHVPREQRPRLASPRLGHRPDQRTGFEANLAHARTWADQNGHLAVHRDTVQDGFRLGWWLAGQRQNARNRERRGLPPSPHLAELAAIDVWWNPPWKTEWQRNYHRALTHPHLRTTRQWLARQHRNRHLLHPGQQQLLACIAIAPPA